MRRTTKLLTSFVFAFAFSSFMPLAHADGGTAMMMLPMMTSAPTGMTFIGFLGSSDYSGQTSSSNSHMKIATREDAALYVASNGEDLRPNLQRAFGRYHQAHPEREVPKMQLASALLANDPASESLY
jgi:uncharacterized protein (TIGR02448 family)